MDKVGAFVKRPPRCSTSWR